MHPDVALLMERNGVSMGSDDAKRTGETFSYTDVLSKITEVHHPPYAAARLLKGRYVVTGDTLLKMVAIFVRLRCGVPVILMGECGCGKTMLLR